MELLGRGSGASRGQLPSVQSLEPLDMGAGLAGRLGKAGPQGNAGVGRLVSARLTDSVRTGAHWH